MRFVALLGSAVALLGSAALLTGSVQAGLRAPGALSDLTTGTYTGNVTSLGSASPTRPWAKATITIRQPPGSQGVATGTLKLHGLQTAFSCTSRFTARNLYGESWLLSLSARTGPCALQNGPGVGPTLEATDRRHLKVEFGLVTGVVALPATVSLGPKFPACKPRTSIRLSMKRGPSASQVLFTFLPATADWDVFSVYEDRTQVYFGGGYPRSPWQHMIIGAPGERITYTLVRGNPSCISASTTFTVTE